MMLGQLNYMIEMCELPNVIMQVIPFEVGAYAAMDRSFIILEFANPVLDVGYTENLFGANQFNDADHYKLVFDESSSFALSEEESIACVRRLIRRA